MMRQIFLRAQEAGIPISEIVSWVDRPADDPRTWRLKVGAPSRIADIFPEYVDFYLTTSERASDGPDDEVDVSNPSFLLVRVWQLAREARSLADAGAARKIPRDYVERIEAHVEQLDQLRGRLRDAIVTAGGTVPRPPPD